MKKQEVQKLIGIDRRTGMHVYEGVPPTSAWRETAAYIGGGLSVVLLVCLVIGWLP